MAYRLSDDQPAMKMAMDVIDVTARMYRIPTFRFARAVSLAKGTTAIIRITGATIATGTMANTIRSAPLGVRSSLVSSFTRSANGCSMPNGPHRFGPIRLWNRPIKRRSTQENRPAPKSTPFARISIMANPATT